MGRSPLTEFEIGLREIISNNLKKVTRGKTQAQISDITGIPPSTLSGYFAKRSTITEENLNIISEKFNVDRSEIDPRYAKNGFTYGNESESKFSTVVSLEDLKKSIQPISPKGRAIGRGFDQLDEEKQDLFEKLLLQMQEDDEDDD
ncbi:helix-turn-helix transcriptional regulator [Enterococcus sp. BWM-S5]|uniref:Helix-turn-helix transcriptional regulator n=1 Tax=Enterococcus larvae TaxID=2794352 RepID=A0ABS4CG11_9ENTE|nr:helix-turn-helix transcriptional regulator [Enterococcus larvae]MBP1044887.1 helix-turn-helix transcriptional regulator [Enterococcus larvae]